jgi:dTDP-4-amino-4,6-dideoxygalactose transaminase
MTASKWDRHATRAAKALLREEGKALRDLRAVARAASQRIVHATVILPPEAPEGDTHSWHLYVLRLADAAPIDRDAFIEGMFAAGIGCSVHYVPLHLHPYWRDRYGLTPEQFPHSQKAFETMVSLPLYTAMSDADVERVISAVRALLEA